MKSEIGKALYLQECIVMRDGIPVYVEYTKRGIVHFYPLHSPGRMQQDKLSNKWDLSSPQLGMANKPGGGFVYLARRPDRNWRQGLTSRNLFHYEKGIKRNLPFSAKNLEIIRSCIERNYFTFEEANSQPFGGAFHKDYAIDREGRLFYKWHEIGACQGKRFTLLSAFCHHERALEDIINGSNS